ncbi:MAG: hypothetical protein MMC33_000664 [Icmadophila ericetorum]|nr:hypothetical protein [Icmadophila ericetorum]
MKRVEIEFNRIPERIRNASGCKSGESGKTDGWWSWWRMGWPRWTGRADWLVLWIDGRARSARRGSRGTTDKSWREASGHRRQNHVETRHDGAGKAAKNTQAACERARDAIQLLLSLQEGVDIDAHLSKENDDSTIKVDWKAALQPTSIVPTSDYEHLEWDVFVSTTREGPASQTKTVKGTSTSDTVLTNEN